MAIDDVPLIDVSSSNLSSIGYDPTTQVLRVVFKNGATYDYASVPKSVFDGLRSAESAGKYFHANVRDRFSFTKR